ncbi:MAG: glycosyltransferase family 4 protein, partial [Acidobacteriota bacterium]|nr:glycosyltransferase family 4 protein [Acidobacteriota bacterium]
PMPAGQTKRHRNDRFLMKIAVIVHGRFHAFDLARALLAEGHDVVVLTNYPVWATKRFGLPGSRVRSFWLNGVVARIIPRLFGRRMERRLAPFLHKSFGRWAAREIHRNVYDLVHGFSGVAEESIRARGKGTLHFIVRGSAHIRVQDRLLAEEAARCGVSIERPSPWMIDREEREYRICDRIVVLSSFALKSFVREGVDPAKLICIPLGVDVKRFRSTPESLAERCRRVLAGGPLKVLYTGNLQFRKGLQDIVHITQTLKDENFRFQMVGTVTDEAQAMVAKLPATVELIPRQPQNSLPQWYAGADLYMLPTIEDGFAVVLTQASANGLPILTTPNCAGPDMVQDGLSGWVLPIRDPAAFVEKLRWCESHRPELVEMIQRVHNQFQPRDWRDVAKDLQEAYLEARLVHQV